MIATLAIALCQPQLANYRLIGRFWPEDGSYTCEWPGSAVQFATESSKVMVHLKASTPNDRWQVEVDGKPTEVLKLDPKLEDYTINLPSSSKHLVTLVRRTECFSGETTWKGVNNNNVPAPHGPSRKIEIIGDSISAGYGVDGKSHDEHYSFDTANAYLAYGWVAARVVKADCTIVAWSGRKMWPDNTIPSIYDYVLPNAKKGMTDHPDDTSTQAVLINLATNDFGPGIPDKEKWCGAYVDFTRKVRSRFPKAHIYLATGSMMTDTWPPNAKHLTTLKEYLDSIKATLNDSKVHRIDFDPQNEQVDGIGADWHPNQNTQRKMGERFAAALKKDLGW
ncbi:MAG: hypothetical protein JST51_09130 [Armatimonadetes bacterium]|nr:hypothetical protein [Armatimonadota bacterium]